MRYDDTVWNSFHEFSVGRFFLVANDASQEVLEHLSRKNYPFVDQRNDVSGLDGYDPPEYIRRVYMGWNRALKESDDIAVLVNSDCMFSPGWLPALLSELKEDTVVCSKIVERRHPVHGINGRCYERDFGDHPDRFRKHDFLEFVSQTRRSENESYGVYMPCAVYKSMALKAGLYPEGNPPKTYGDREFFERLSRVGVRHITALNSIVYHFKEGEMSEQVLIS